MHIKYGNTVSDGTRARWESTDSHQGIQLSNLDETVIPDSHAAVCLKASEVSDGSIGFSFCNPIFLQNKLRVTGGHFLVLVLPGKLQGSLRRQINDTKPGLLAQCHECILTLFDPVRNVNFPRACVLINLGTHAVIPATLEPTIPLPSNSTTSVLVQAFQNKAPEEWAESCYTASKAQSHVLEKIAKLLNCPAHSLERWGFVYRNENVPWMKLCVRIPSDKAAALYNSKDSLCFFRKFLTKDQPLPVEENVAIIWSSCTTIAAMKQTADTLQGILGYVGNSSSLGVRVKTEHIAAARQALSRPNPRFTPTNQNVAGHKTFEVSGWPHSTSAQTVISTLATAVEDKAKWTPWHVIPTKHVAKQDMCAWHVRADSNPIAERIVLADAMKLTIRELPSRDALRKIEIEKQMLKSEKAKAERHQRILEQNYESADPWTSPSHDPWQTKPPTKGKGKGKDRAKTKPDQSSSQSSNQATPNAGSELQSTVQQLRKDVDTLSHRMDQQDHKIDGLQFQITGNHQEIMTALRSLGASSNPSSEPSGNQRAGTKKRQSDLSNTPLRALADRPQRS